jgi:hypothetical protein
MKNISLLEDGKNRANIASIFLDSFNADNGYKDSGRIVLDNCRLFSSFSNITTVINKNKVFTEADASYPVVILRDSHLVVNQKQGTGFFPNIFIGDGIRGQTGYGGRWLIENCVFKSSGDASDRLSDNAFIVTNNVNNFDYSTHFTFSNSVFYDTPNAGQSTKKVWFDTGSTGTVFYDVISSSISNSTLNVIIDSNGTGMVKTTANGIFDKNPDIQDPNNLFYIRSV